MLAKIKGDPGEGGAATADARRFEAPNILALLDAATGAGIRPHLIARGEALVERLRRERRWSDAQAVEALMAFCLITEGLWQASASAATRHATEAFDHSLSSEAIHNVRELLTSNGVPAAAFFDDQVANALVQRDRLALIVLKLAAAIPNAALEGTGAQLRASAHAALVDNGCGFVLRSEPASEPV